MSYLHRIKPDGLDIILKVVCVTGDEGITEPVTKQVWETCQVLRLRLEKTQSEIWGI